MLKIIAHLVIVHMRKYKLNEDFFKIIDSEIKAYFLGFIFADGYVNEKNNYVEITIHKKDKEILDNLKIYLYPDGRPLKIIKNNYIRLVINSKIIVTDLVKYGCMQAKTYKIKFPKINRKYYSHFIRGYFDGDGCVTINDGTLFLSIIGTIDFLDSIKSILMEKCNVNNTKYDDRHPNKKNNIRALRYGGNVLINRIYHYVYDNSTISLERKKNKFLVILKNKDYFCDSLKFRELKKHKIEYDGVVYNQTELSKKLSEITNIKTTTIRRKLQNGWTIDEIIDTKLNHRRKKLLKYG